MSENEKDQTTSSAEDAVETTNEDQVVSGVVVGEADAQGATVVAALS